VNPNCFASSGQPEATAWPERRSHQHDDLLRTNSSFRVQCHQKGMQSKSITLDCAVTASSPSVFRDDEGVILQLRRSGRTAGAACDPLAIGSHIAQLGLTNSPHSRCRPTHLGCPVHRRPEAWHRLILPHLENAAASFRLGADTPPGDEGVSERRIEVDRHGVIEHAASS
jgi:hypothetical protein